jgi:hypothetical protein
MIIKEVRHPDTNELVATHNFTEEPSSIHWASIVATYFPPQTIDKIINNLVKEKKFLIEKINQGLISTALSNVSDDDLKLQQAKDDCAREFSNCLMSFFKTSNQIESSINALQAVWVHHKLRAIPLTQLVIPGADPIVLPETWSIDLMNLIISGDMEVAFIVLNSMQVDDMTMPWHFLNAQNVGILKLAIAQYLGWA